MRTWSRSKSLMIMIPLALAGLAKPGIPGTMIHWPLRDAPPPGHYEIWGTYGDARQISGTNDLVFHPGVDLHQRGGSPAYPVKNGLVVWSGPDQTSRGWNYILIETVNRCYGYGHVDTVSLFFEDEERWRVLQTGDRVPDTTVSFCKVWESSRYGYFPDWDDHLEFGLFKNGSEPKSNPLWQNAGPGFEYLACAVAPDPKVYDGYDIEKGIALGIYDFGKVGDESSSENHYFCPLEIWTGIDVDVMVFANCKGMVDGFGPVGVCVLEMAMCSPSPCQPYDWQFKLDFTEDLPGNEYAEYVFALEGYDNEGEETCKVIPRTVSSTSNDRMWYIITNFDNQGTVTPESGIRPYAPSDLWFRVTNHLGHSEVYGPVRVESHEGPAPFLMYFRSVSSEDGIELRWRIEKQDHVTGCRLCRRDSVDGSFKAIDDSWEMWSGTATPWADFTYLDSRVAAGKLYCYCVEALSRDGSWLRLDPVVNTLWLPETVNQGIVRVLPNPFRGFTDISLCPADTRSDKVSLSVVDCCGREVWSYSLDEMSAWVVRWHAVDKNHIEIAPGVYFCHAESGGLCQTVKVIHLK